MTKKQERSLILILGAVATLGPFSIDTYLPGFPDIARDLNTDIAKVSLTLTSYFIGISAGQLIYGPLLDRYGRKKPLIIGISLYLVAALGCMLAPGIYYLIALRLLQALGGCVGMVASRAIIRDRFEVKEIARVFSSLILVMGVAPIIAPTLGGYLSSNFGWRSIFALLALLALAIILLITRVLAESRGPDPAVSLRPTRIAWNYWQVLTDRRFFVYSIAGSMAMAGLFAYIGGSPFVLMELMNFDETTYGWIFGANAGGFILGSQINRVVLQKRNSRVVTEWSAVLMLLTTLILVIGTLLGLLSAVSFLVGLFCFLFFLGFLNPNSNALAMEPFSENAGVASALIGSVRMLGGALSTALAGALHNGTEFPMIAIMLGCSLIATGLIYYGKFADIREQKSDESRS